MHMHIVEQKTNKRHSSSNSPQILQFECEKLVPEPLVLYILSSLALRALAHSWSSLLPIPRLHSCFISSSVILHISHIIALIESGGRWSVYQYLCCDVQCALCNHMTTSASLKLYSRPVLECASNRASFAEQKTVNRLWWMMLNGGAPIFSFQFWSTPRMPMILHYEYGEWRTAAGNIIQ